MNSHSRPARPGRDAFLEQIVRWGRLEFADFARLSPAAAGALMDPADPDWQLALNNTPQVWRGLPIADLRSAICAGQPAAVGQIEHRTSGIGDCTLAAIHAAQSRLVRLHARALLIAKAPALFDALPWHDVDLGPLLRGRRLWQTRFLLSGGHASVTMCRLRRSAGVYVVESDPVLAGYLQRKADKERVKKARVVRAPLAQTGLPARSADLALAEPGPDLEPEIVELERVAAEVVVLGTDPLAEVDPQPLVARGYREAALSSRLGPARAWSRKVR
jgi:hypothetical protein